MIKNNVFQISTIGFSDSELRLISMVLSLSEKRARKYVFSEGQSTNYDVALINGDEVEVYKQFVNQRDPRPHIVISKNGYKESVHCIIRPVAPSKLLQKLDDVTTSSLSNTPDSIVNKLRETEVKGTVKDIAAKLKNSSEKVDKILSRKPTKPSYAVLVVDDCRPVRQAIGKKIHELKVRTTAVATGEKALQLIGERKFDLIFLDVELPERDGYDICKEIKSRPETKHIPVCMLTGKGSPINKIKGKMSGCNDYLTKPVTLRQLVATVHKYLPGIAVAENK